MSKDLNNNDFEELPLPDKIIRFALLLITFAGDLHNLQGQISRLFISVKEGLRPAGLTVMP